MIAFLKSKTEEHILTSPDNPILYLYIRVHLPLFVFDFMIFLLHIWCLFSECKMLCGSKTNLNLGTIKKSQLFLLLISFPHNSISSCIFWKKSNIWLFPPGKFHKNSISWINSHVLLSSNNAYYKSIFISSKWFPFKWFEIKK